MTESLNRSVPLNGRVANTFSDGARFQSHRPVAPQRHRERVTMTARNRTGPDYWFNTDGTAAECCILDASYQQHVAGSGVSEPHDGRSWTEEAMLRAVAVLAVVGVVLAFVAGPGR